VFEAGPGEGTAVSIDGPFDQSAADLAARILADAREITELDIWDGLAG